MKRALLVGINYVGTQNQLNGCVNDVMLMADIITSKFGFGAIDKRVLTDASATTANIIDRLKWLVSGAVAGDTLLFHYSGHGSQVVDIDYDKNEEPDGLDEILCPVDLDWRSNIVTDDDMRKIFATLPVGVNLTVLLDCCHSGTGLREFCNPFLPVSPNRNKSIPMPADIAARAIGTSAPPITRKALSPSLAPHLDTTHQNGILMSGCKSSQTSADAWIHNNYNGAFTYFISEILKSSSYTIQYGDLMDKVNLQLKAAGYAQEPELDCNSELVAKQFLSTLVG
jgi:hypothetical protein